ncbi:MAG: phosphomannomutase/phosphoglucomutase [Clostridia bacterium]|nr:phosphomannomutase/phosphoglucomutase [Clostridia bacterium]
MIDYKQFKSGTDIRGVASEGVENEHINLTDEVICTITDAFLVWLSDKLQKPAQQMKISVGHDSRISADRIKNDVISTLVSRGVWVVDCSLASTPSMFMTTVEIGCDAAVQITASHHPFNRNGLKFFVRSGGLDGADISDILAKAAAGEKVEAKEGKCEKYDFMKDYAKILRQLIISKTGSDKPLEGFRIVVDAGNGAGGFYAYDVLEPLGANINGSQFLEPDGMFPNHIPNPENEQAMASISAATVNSGADLGVIFDTDVDRASCVDNKGREINRNRIVALAAAIALEGNEGGTVVTDSVTSAGLKTFIEADLKGKHHRFKRGYKNVIDESIRLNNEGILSPLAIETSGHAAFSENYFLDDGAYLITKIIIKMAQLKKEGKTIDDLIKNLKEPVEAKELRFKITDPDFRSYGMGVISDLESYAKNKGWDIAPDNHEGIRISFGDNMGNGWFLLRLSVHDPIMPLNIESDVEGGVMVIAKQLYEFLKGCDKLDLSAIENFIK